MVNLGDKVKDRLTPFEGVVVGKADYLYGCKQVLVRSEAMKDGTPIDAVWMDEDRVEVVEQTAVAVPESAAVRAGGPCVA